MCFPKAYAVGSSGRCQEAIAGGDPRGSSLTKSVCCPSFVLQGLACSVHMDLSIGPTSSSSMCMAVAAWADQHLTGTAAATGSHAATTASTGIGAVSSEVLLLMPITPPLYYICIDWHTMSIELCIYLHVYICMLWGSVSKHSGLSRSTIHVCIYSTCRHVYICCMPWDKGLCTMLGGHSWASEGDSVRSNPAQTRISPRQAALENLRSTKGDKRSRQFALTGLSEARSEAKESEPSTSSMQCDNNTYIDTYRHNGTYRSIGPSLSIAFPRFSLGSQSQPLYND